MGFAHFFFTRERARASRSLTVNRRELPAEFPPAAALVAVAADSSAEEAPAVDNEGGFCVVRTFAHGSYGFWVQQRGRE